jgi:hypothetical protein
MEKWADPFDAVVAECAVEPWFGAIAVWRGEATKVRHPSSQGWTAVSLSDYRSMAPATSERPSPLINSYSIYIYIKLRLVAGRL